MAAMRDLDGSVLGKKIPKRGVCCVKKLPLPLPQDLPLRCLPTPNSNAVACPGSCFRTLYFEYDEPKFSPYNGDVSYSDLRNLTDGPRKLGDYSYWKVKRLKDGDSILWRGT